MHAILLMQGCCFMTGWPPPHLCLLTHLSQCNQLLQALLPGCSWGKGCKNVKYHTTTQP